MRNGRRKVARGLEDGDTRETLLSDTKEYSGGEGGTGQGEEGASFNDQALIGSLRLGRCTLFGWEI